MGFLYVFKCNSCDYIAKSSGQEDSGFTSVVRPYICNTCKEVCDVLVGQMGEIISKEMLNKTTFDNDGLENFYSCPDCSGTDLSEWCSNNYKCPKCSGFMFKDETAPIEVWD
tara:strand:- start:144 stop:479 length:336 start_codon:yes stop_codon:yes gene_type:complete